MNPMKDASRREQAFITLCCVDDTVDVPLVDTEVVADEVADVVTVDETLDV